MTKPLRAAARESQSAWTTRSRPRSRVCRPAVRRTLASRCFGWMHRRAFLRLSPLLLAAALACGGPARREPAAPSGASAQAAAADSSPIDLDFHIAESIYRESIWPVEKHMCRGNVSREACREVCRATTDLREISSRICTADDRPAASKCRDSRDLSRRAATICSFCSGAMTRRPCPDLF